MSPVVDGVNISHWSGATYFPAEDTLLLLKSVKPGSGRFLDVGTGTGIVGIRAGLIGYEVVSTDMDRNALRNARANAAANGVHISFIECDLLSCFSGSFSVIAFNPPYLPEDGVPDRQLAGGPSGVDVAIEFMREAAQLASPDGEVLVVISSLGDTDAFERSCSEEWFLEEKSTARLGFEKLILYSGKLRQPGPK